MNHNVREGLGRVFAVVAVFVLSCGADAQYPQVGGTGAESATEEVGASNPTEEEVPTFPLGDSKGVFSLIAPDPDFTHALGALERHRAELTQLVRSENLILDNVDQAANGGWAIVLTVKELTPGLVCRVPDRVEGVPVDIHSSSDDR